MWQFGQFSKIQSHKARKFGGLKFWKTGKFFDKIFIDLIKFWHYELGHLYKYYNSHNDIASCIDQEVAAG